MRIRATRGSASWVLIISIFFPSLSSFPTAVHLGISNMIRSWRSSSLPSELPSFLPSLRATPSHVNSPKPIPYTYEGQVVVAQNNKRPTRPDEDEESRKRFCYSPSEGEDDGGYFSEDEFLIFWQEENCGNCQRQLDLEEYRQKLKEPQNIDDYAEERLERESSPNKYEHKLAVLPYARGGWHSHPCLQPEDENEQLEWPESDEDLPGCAMHEYDDAYREPEDEIENLEWPEPNGEDYIDSAELQDAERFEEEERQYCAQQEELNLSLEAQRAYNMMQAIRTREAELRHVETTIEDLKTRIIEQDDLLEIGEQRQFDIEAAFRRPFPKVDRLWSKNPKDSGQV